MRWFIAILICVSGCATGEFEYDFSVAGILVQTNEYDVQPELVEETVGYTEQAFRWRGLDISLPMVFEDLGVTAEYVEDHPDLAPDAGSPYLYSGRLVGHEVIVRGEDNCFHNYHVLSHELIHLVAQDVMGVSNEENCDHMTPLLFDNWSAVYKKYQGQTVEEFANVLIMEMCIREFNANPW